MLDIFKKPVTIIIIFVAILLALGWSYYQSWSEGRNTTKPIDQVPVEITNLANVDASEFDEVVTEEFALAKTKAQEVNANNSLMAIVVELPSMEINSGDSRYIFSNPEDVGNNWVFTISQLTGNYIRASIPKDDYMGDLDELNTKLWKYNYVTALQIAESNQGLKFRENNSIENITLTLKHSNPNNWLLWSVVYKSTTGNELSVKIDSNSGQIIEE